MKESEKRRNAEECGEVGGTGGVRESQEERNRCA